MAPTTIKLWAATLLAAGLIGTAAAQALRPEVGRPLQQAGELLKAGKTREALAKVREAEAVPNKTPAEELTILRMKGAAAQRAGDNATAIAAYEAAFPKLSGAEAAQTAEALAFAYSARKDFARASQWIQKAQALGNSSPQLKQLQTYLLTQSGDYAAIAKEAAGAVAAAEQAGRHPEESDLLRLADAQQRLGNRAGELATLDKLLHLYPKKQYWAVYLDRLPRKSGFSDRFALDVMRLKLATANLESTDDYMEMAQLALQAGLPAEGLAVIDKGFASGALGKGPEAARQQRLRELAIKQDNDAKASIAARAAAAQSAKDGNDLVQIGYAYVTMGQADRGVALIQEGIAKGGLKRPDDARLRLGQALLKDGKKAKAVQVLRSVQGSDGAADLARLFALLAG
jgi:hypothetical protein